MIELLFYNTSKNNYSHSWSFRRYVSQHLEIFLCNDHNTILIYLHLNSRRQCHLSPSFAICDLEGQSETSAPPYAYKVLHFVGCGWQLAHVRATSRPTIYFRHNSRSRCVTLVHETTSYRIVKVLPKFRHNSQLENLTI
jgi:hypothetical protein